MSLLKNKNKKKKKRRKQYKNYFFKIKTNMPTNH